MNPKAIIIGSGIGGLCAGIRLLKKGFDVEILEKNGVAGGVAGVYECQNQAFRFDNTASIAIDPQEYDRIFLDVGLDPREYVEFLALDVLYQVFFANGKQYSLYEDIEKQRDSFETCFDIPFEEYHKFVKDYESKYSMADHAFLTEPFDQLRDLFRLQTWKEAVKLKPFCTANAAISKYIANEDFRHFLLFQCLYMGLSPYHLRSTYATIPAVSQQKGIRHIRGGMTAYTNGLLRAFLDLGGKIQYHTEVEAIEIADETACGIRTEKGRQKADIILSDADYCETVSKLIPKNFSPRALIRKDPASFEMSCSVFLLRLALSGTQENLSVHNIYINEEFEAEMERIFDGKLPQNPSLYVYYPSALDDSFGDGTYSCVNVMVRVPNLSFDELKWGAETVQALKTRCFEILSKMTGDQELEKKVLYQDYLTPLDLKQKYNCHEGAAFGIAHSARQSMMFRPQATSPAIKNLYFVGSSIHPGNGVTMVMKGAKIAVNLITELTDS